MTTMASGRWTSEPGPLALMLNAKATGQQRFEVLAGEEFNHGVVLGYELLLLATLQYHSDWKHFSGNSS